MSTLFSLSRKICTSSIIPQARVYSSASVQFDLKDYNEEQVKLMKEECIEVDENDQVIGSKSKLDCHLLSNGPPLHRAFSLFLFNSKNELLLQQRAGTKITFADHYTNTCCSHPLHFPLELNEANAMGVKLAAQRRMKCELGVEQEQLPISSIKYLTRIMYKASSSKVWGEHEIDYVLFAKQDVDLKPNPNEVSEVKYVTQSQLKEFLKSASKTNTLITPWFNLICKSHLFKWWNNIDNLDMFCDHKTIHRY